MALAQTGEVAVALSRAWPDLAPEIVKFRPQGDRDQVSKLDRHGGKGGAFVSEIRDAVRQGALQCAMHSLKDMPGDEEAPGLVIGAYLRREPPTDALVIGRGLDAAAALATKLSGLRIGTNSVRRGAFLRRLYPQAEVIHFRGAVDTRIRKLDERTPQKLPEGSETEPADALVVAKAGLFRVGHEDRIVHEFTHDEMLPAAGQGIVAVECAANDWETLRRLAAIDDPASRACALAEREVLWVLNGHCNTPIAAHAQLSGAEMALAAAVMSEDGATMVVAAARGSANRPRELGREVGLDLLAKGAAALIEASRP